LIGEGGGGDDAAGKYEPGVPQSQRESHSGEELVRDGMVKRRGF